MLPIVAVQLTTRSYLLSNQSSEAMMCVANIGLLHGNGWPILREYCRKRRIRQVSFISSEIYLRWLWTLSSTLILVLASFEISGRSVGASVLLLDLITNPKCYIGIWTCVQNFPSGSQDKTPSPVCEKKLHAALNKKRKFIGSIVRNNYGVWWTVMAVNGDGAIGPCGLFFCFLCW
jgi:hypothetical protein